MRDKFSDSGQTLFKHPGAQLELHQGWTINALLPFLAALVALYTPL